MVVRQAGLDCHALVPEALRDALAAAEWAAMLGAFYLFIHTFSIHTVYLPSVNRWAAMLGAFYLPTEVLNAQTLHHDASLRHVHSRLCSHLLYLPTKGDVLLPFDGAGPIANATGATWSAGNVPRLWGHRLPARVTDTQVRQQHLPRMAGAVPGSPSSYGRRCAEHLPHMAGAVPSTYLI